MPEDRPLLFAVLDGQSPNDWPLFGTRFSDLMKEAKRQAKPKGLTPAVRDLFDLYVEPMIKSPDELLKVDKLDGLAGVILDPLPAGGVPDDLQKRLAKYHAHILKAAKVTKKGDPIFKMIGYEIWFVSEEDPERMVECVEKVRVSAEVLDASNLSHVFIPNKAAFIDHMATYLSNVYLKLYRRA